MPQQLSKNNRPIKASWWHALLKVTSQEDVDLPLDMDTLRQRENHHLATLGAPAGTLQRRRACMCWLRTECFAGNCDHTPVVNILYRISTESECK